MTFAHPGGAAFFYTRVALPPDDWLDLIWRKEALQLNISVQAFSSHQCTLGTLFGDGSVSDTGRTVRILGHDGSCPMEAYTRGLVRPHMVERGIATQHQPVYKPSAHNKAFSESCLVTIVVPVREDLCIPLEVDPFLLAFNETTGRPDARTSGRIEDKYYSMGTYRRGGRSSCPKRNNGTLKATAAEGYEHGQWTVKQSKENTPTRYNEFAIEDRTSDESISCCCYACNLFC
jgi:hypothetical protein